MTKRSNEDVANALHQLGGGEPDADNTATPGPAPVPPPSTLLSTDLKPGRPSRPTRPLGPLGPEARVVQPRPTLPGGGHLDLVQRDAPAVEQVGDDDVAMMPAPSTEYLAHRAPAVPRPRPAGQSRGIGATMIPVVLTTGALLIAAAALKYIVHPDAQLAVMPSWLAAILAGAGFIMMGVAVTRALQARAAEQRND